MSEADEIKITSIRRFNRITGDEIMTDPDQIARGIMNKAMFDSWPEHLRNDYQECIATALREIETKTRAERDRAFVGMMHRSRREGYRRGVEESAKLAESMYGTQFHDKIEIRTGKKIARNLRALNEPTQAGE